MQKTIYSENPILDIWNRLLHYSYLDTLSQHRATRTGRVLDGDAAMDTSASIKQAFEYFRAAENVTLQTEPLQLYYGAVSLLRAMTMIITGKEPSIEHHGMATKEVNMSVGQIPLTTRGDKGGALGVYADAILGGCKIAGNEKWPLAEILGSLPDCYELHRICYPSGDALHCIPVERLIIADDEIVDRIHLEGLPPGTDLVARVQGISERYLPPQMAREGHLVLRTKLGAIDDITLQSLSGRRFLSVTHREKNSTNPSELLFIFMGLFILGSLSRYHPKLWGTFVGSTALLERLLVQEFLGVARRKLPNLVLNLISGQHFIFSAQRVEDIDRRQFALASKLKDTVTAEVSRQLRNRSGDGK